ncbi:MAG TPA: peptidylprolyl isomerase [Dokdonella sp.]|uniref:peptidylprolyl isomerase n=1 Tax=Dokdonella sp. TaxID=2291710 RepID=UPI002CA7F96C|nr:peptidylprolyl isomerase [Dokdonella sp.]HNV08165.1 peptidylprolyl isomerase [Dokdonella sp.]HPW03630.1 peptidylprolyl isomerase [Dokdonella sp.]
MPERRIAAIVNSRNFLGVNSVFNSLRLTLSVILLLGAMGAAHAAERYPTDTVVAKRGDAVVTMLDVDAALLRVPERIRANVMNSPKRIEELIDRLLTNRQLASEARAEKLNQGEAFNRAVQLETENLLSELRLVEMRTNLNVGKVDELAQERYEVNPEAYSIQGSTSARHILIDTKSRSEGEARKLADELHARIGAGEDFDALVMKYSDDPSKTSNKGVIFAADSESMDPAFADAVKKLASAGDVSPVVKSSFGFHIIKLEQRAAARPRSFAEVKQQIVGEIEKTMREAKVKEHLDELKAMPLEATPEVVASLRTRYLPEDAQQQQP